MKMIEFSDELLQVAQTAISNQIKVYDSKIKRLEGSHSYDPDVYELKHKTYCDEKEKLISLLEVLS